MCKFGIEITLTRKEIVSNRVTTAAHILEDQAQTLLVQIRGPKRVSLAGVCACDRQPKPHSKKHRQASDCYFIERINLVVTLLVISCTTFLYLQEML